MNNPFYRFYAEINALLQSQERTAREQVPLIVTQTLQAEGCAIYIPDKGEYTLQDAYSPISFHPIFTQYTNDVPVVARYYNDQDKISAELGQDTWTRALILPLPGNDTPAALLFAYWTANCPLDDLAAEIAELWQTAASQLSVIYYWQPLVAQLQQREQSLVTLFQRVDQEFEDNRRQVARTLYQEVGQSLTSLMLQLKLLQDTDDLEFVQGRLGGIKYIVSQTLEEVLHISRSQRPLLLDKLGLPAALAAYVQEYQEEKEARIQLNCPEFSSPLPEMFETVVYRCVQEALSLDQIPLREISLVINVSMKDSKLFLQVLYNGYDPQKLNSFSEAVLRIEERVKRAQGKFWVSNLSEQNLSLNVLLFLS